MLALCLVALTFTASFPLGGNDVAGADPSHPGLRWEEQHRFSGNCTQYPEHDYFFVNETALSIVIQVNFTTNMSFPGANLVIYGPDSFVLFSKDIGKVTYTTIIDNVTKRGRWRVALSISSCSYDHPVFYEMMIIVHNRFLVAPFVTPVKIKLGDLTNINANALNLTGTEECRFDLGGQITSWSTSTNITYKFRSPGIYDVKVMVRDSSTYDANTTGWSDSAKVTVEGRDKPLPKLDIFGCLVQMAAIVLFPLVLISLILREALKRRGS